MNMFIMPAPGGGNGESEHRLYRICYNTSTSTEKPNYIYKIDSECVVCCVPDVRSWKT